MSQGTMSMFSHQWRLTRIQLVNWGTFCGYHDFPLAAFDEGDGTAPVVMITGESGTGKSTLFDAKTAVLQKHNVPFNVASNAQQKGRARSGNQRNLYTYVLGKQDDVFYEETDEEREVRLRPTTSPQWAAVVLTFQDTQGAVFSAARFYYVPAHGQESDLRQFMLTAHDDLDPRSLESHLTQSLNKKLLYDVYPTATVHDTASGFLSTVYEHMEIGPNADGDNAMKLHQRIQGGYPITDVDALFKELVIENKDTYLRFPPIEGGICVFGHGNEGATHVCQIPWIHEAEHLYYWGDMDANGLEILNDYRKGGLDVASILMDIDAYRRYERFGTSYATGSQRLEGHKAREVDYLVGGERELYDLLVSPHCPGPRRIEQERIPLAHALEAFSYKDCIIR